MKKLLIILVVLIIVKMPVSAQGSYVGTPQVSIKNLVPQSPQAGQLARVNEITVNSARGVPQVAFTLYTASAGGLKIPISVSYDASGIKYDDIPSTVGLKWSLQAGGEISRNINGREDESFYFANAYKYSQSIIANWDLATDTAQNFLTDVNTNHKDLTQDEYSYNYLTNSGYFSFRNNKLWDSEAPYTTKIEADDFTGFHNLRIIDAFGNTAWFGYNKEERSIISYSGSGYRTPNIPSGGSTTWKLTKIKAYTNEEALFEYDTLSYDISKTASQAYIFRHARHIGQGLYDCNCGTSSFSESIFNARYFILVPKKITTPAEEVNFYYSTDNALSIYKRRLDSITVTDRIYQTRVKKIKFKYGKYSSVNLLRLDEIWEIGSNNDSLLVAGFHYNTSSPASINSKARDIFGYNNGAGNSYLISTNDANCPSLYRSNDRTINATAIKNGILDSVFYPTGGKATFFYSPNKTGDTCAPGVRVDSIKYFNADNSLAYNTSYTYSKITGGYVFSGIVNNIDVNQDNTICPIKTFNSEYPFNQVDGSAAFWYDNVEIRKKAAVSTNNQLTKEYYIGKANCYGKQFPIPSKRIYYRNNSLTDTLRLETYTYDYLDVDTIGMDWLYPGFSYLPSQTYELDGLTVNNTTACKILHNFPGIYNIIEPRNTVLASLAVKEFDGNSGLTKTNTKFYNNYWQPAAEKMITSKGTLDSAVYNYLYTNGGTTATSAISSNLYGLVDKTSRYTGSSTLLERARARYTTQSNGFILPDSLFKQALTYTEVLDKIVTAYDTSGQITEVNDKQGFYTSLLRNYNNQLLTAQASGARLSQVAHSSFEAESKGGWTYTGTPSSDAATPTGLKCYFLPNGNITKTGLTSATYLISLWGKAGAYTYSVNSTSPVRTGKTMNGWTYYEYEVTGTSITVSGTGYIDELRLYPKGAQMVTYTYQPLIGITSQCDINNHLIYYEYDAFGRLLLTRDEDKNILKTYEYKYQANTNQ